MSAANQPQPNSPKHPNAGSANHNMMQRLTGRKSWVRGLAVLALVGVYAAARPAINERTGLNLPALKVDSRGQVVSANADQPVSSSRSHSAQSNSAQKAEPKLAEAKSVADATKSPAEKDSSKTNPNSTTSPDKFSPAKSSPDAKKSGPLASRVRTESNPNTNSPSSKKPSSNSPSSKTSSPASDKADPSLRYGLLRDTGGDRYVSPAGLLYTPGSAEGHRIEHVRRHTEDDPGRPGSHGVFDGGIEGALKTIDNAYVRAKEGTRTTKQEEDGRVVYTVDMGKRVGFVGGRDGGRRNKPMARRVTLVLEGNRVITAYPK